MVWTVPITFANGDPLTAAQLNIYVRDNLMETAVAKATTAGRIFSAIGVNRLGEQQWARAYSGGDTLPVDRTFPQTEDENGELFGPTVTVQHNGMMLILIDARVRSEGGTGDAVCAASVNGQRPDNTNYAIRSGREGNARQGTVQLWTGPAGLATVTLAYGTTGNSSVAHYGNRRLTVIPF